MFIITIIHHAVQARYHVLLLSTSKLLVITSLLQLAWAGAHAGAGESSACGNAKMPKGLQV